MMLIIRIEFEALAAEQELEVMRWVGVPHDNTCLGSMALNTEPTMFQV